MPHNENLEVWQANMMNNIVLLLIGVAVYKKMAVGGIAPNYKTEHIIYNTKRRIYDCFYAI